MEVDDRDTASMTERPDSSWDPQLSGRQVGDFDIGERIGEGGYGVVYRGTQRTLSRDVVIKVLRRGVDKRSSRTQRFLREAQLAAQLDHPYAAHIYAFGVEDDGILWIAMELVRGTPLGELLAAQGAISLARFVPLLEKICEVVHTAHQQGIVHRDIKPSNLMVLSRAGRLLPKLLDLGIARVLDEDESAGEDAIDTEDASASDSIGPRSISLDELHHDGTTASLTRRDVSIGSPPYMAPEQWIAASQADARSDQYAVAVLAYEALTGERPFHGRSPMSLAMAHACKSVPPLGPGFPRELDEVLGRALAKKRAERYDDVLAFARAFRAAAGLDDETELRPRLPADVREMVTARAPQPLADSVAFLEAARGSGRALHAAHQVIHVAVRFLGLLALAAVPRVGSGDGPRGDDARRALRQLRDRAMTTRQWVDLTRTLARPFAEQPDVHPIPELVIACGDGSSDSGARTGDENPASMEGSGPRAGQVDDAIPMRDLMSRLVAAGFPDGDDPLDTRRDHDADAALQRLLPELTRLLRRLAFLDDYPLVVRSGDRRESWMGARRSVRPEVSVRGAVPAGSRPDREPAGKSTSDVEDPVSLTTRDGEFLLSLTPFCQLLVPAPGAPEEIFLFDGSSRFGARLVSFPVGFERQDTHFWSWYRREVLAGEIAREDDKTRDQDAERAPYKGLATFAPDDADHYVGREREVDGFVNRLRVAPFLAVVGPSGAGKSSFVQAGVIPALPAGWRTLTVRPGPSPFARLLGALQRAEILEVNRDALHHEADRLARDLDGLGRALRGWAARSGEVLLLVVDQFEELLTLCQDGDERQRYADALMRTAQRVDDPVRVVVTLRDDFLIRAGQLTALRERLDHSLQIVSTPPPKELERILVEPARRVGYRFEDERLPGEMVEAVADEPGALALLSFTASRLWELRDRRRRLLTRPAYQELGGVGGALAQHAEITLAEMPAGEKDLVREVFRQVVTAEGTRAVLTRSELEQLLGEGEQADHVLESLIAARLLVASEGETGEDRVEVIHEALLSSWPRLVRWQRDDAESVRLRDQLRAAARQWDERGRPRGLLWRGEALMEYQVWKPRYAGALTDVEQSFARASLSDEARGRRLRHGLVIAAFAILAVVLAVVIRLERRGEVLREKAERLAVESQELASESQRRLVDLYREQGRRDLLDGDPMSAFVYLTEARKSDSAGSPDPGLRFMLARAAGSLDGQLMVLPGHEGIVSWVDITADGSRIATAGFDKTVKLWDGRTGQLLRTFDEFTDIVWRVDFRPDGQQLAIASASGALEVRDVVTGERLWTAAHDRGVTWVGYSSDGLQLASTSHDGTARIRDAASGRVLSTASGHESGVYSAAWSPDGAYLVTGGLDGSARIWRAATATTVATIEGHPGGVLSVQVSPDGSRVVTTSRGTIARVFPITGPTTRQPVLTLRGHTETILRASFSPDSTRLVTASSDHVAKIWDAATGELVRDIAGHDDGVTYAGYSPDGRRILTASRDGKARLWDARTGALRWTHIGHEDAVWMAGFDATGERVLTAGMDGTARVWSASMARYEQSYPHDREVYWAVSSPDGSSIATVERTGSVTVWSRDGEVRRSLDVGAGVARVGWSPDSEHLITAAGGLVDSHTTPGSHAAVWRIASGRQRFSIDQHDGRVTHAAYDPAGSRIVTSGADGTARIWRADDGELLRTLRGHDGVVRFVAFDSSGTRVVTAGEDCTARIWELEEGGRVTVLAGHTFPLNTARFSPDGARVVTAAEDKTARIWTTAGELVATIDDHAGVVSSAVFGPDGHLVATASSDGTARISDARSGTVLWSIEHGARWVRSVQFGIDGRTLLTIAGDAATLWDLDRGDRQLADPDFSICRVTHVLQRGELRRRAIAPACFLARPE